MPLIRGRACNSAWFTSRAALRYTNTEDSKPVVRDLKKIYQSAIILGAKQALEAFAQTWGEKYPTIMKTCRTKWQDIITIYRFPRFAKRSTRTMRLHR